MFFLDFTGNGTYSNRSLSLLLSPGPITSVHMPCKNITRYTYETTAFQGYRLAICKNKRLFTRYFSDSQYGGADAALQEAMRVRDNIFKLFEQGNLTVSQIFAKYTVRSRRQSAADRREKMVHGKRALIHVRLKAKVRS